ncbi:MAG TPA: cytochrome ubiquinol oxidase subunit I [Steroidobacteraceae bacterium]|nr:cytochrome ubiquinol oxidase subunit I [Steroidobacteraceae bacterium]
MSSALLASRIQFAWVIGWHILLPAFTVGLSSYIAVLETLWFVRRREVYFRLSSLWTRIFAVAFGMGVVSGVIMPFQFGTNWSRFSDATANVLSPLFAYEVLFAFFLESAFLGVLLFGRRLVPRWAHLVAGLMVGFGTLMSSFWILAANSWMQTPAGYRIINGRFFPTDWLQIIFNPSFPFRFAHTVVGFYITTALVVLGVAAYYLRADRHPQESRVMLYQALGLLTVLVPLQIFIGDAHGLNTLKYQPEKLAAIEARWDTQRHFPLTLFAIPDQKSASNRYALDLPGVGSLILTHDRNGSIRGLKSFPRDTWPPVIYPFFAFRIMVAIGLATLALVLTAWVLQASGRLLRSRLFLRICELTSPLGFLAVLAGWTTTEVGRQPWTVYGLLHTADSVSPSLTGANVIVSLLGYAAVYLIMYPVGVRFMWRSVQRGPSEPTTQPQVIEGGRPEHPVEALPRIGAPASAATGEPLR